MSDFSVAETGLVSADIPLRGAEAVPMPQTDYAPGVGRLQACMDSMRSFVTEQRRVAGAALAVIALSLSACETPAEHSAVPASGSPAAAAESPQTTTTEAPRAVKPDFRPGEKEEVAAATELGALKDADLTVLSRENTAESELVILGYKGTKPSEKVVNEFKAAVNAAEILASRNQDRIAGGLQLGAGPKQDVSYQLQPGKAAGAARTRHFAVFTANQQDVSDLIPQNTPQGGYTKRTSQGINISILPQTPNSAREAFTEGFRAGSTVVLSPAFKQSAEQGKTDLTNLRVANVSEPTIDQRLKVLVNLMAQREATSWAHAREQAAAGVPYSKYAETAVVEIPAHAKTGAARYAISSEQYAGLGYPA